MAERMTVRPTLKLIVLNQYMSHSPSMSGTLVEFTVLFIIQHLVQEQHFSSGRQRGLCIQGSFSFVIMFLRVQFSSLWLVNRKRSSLSCVYLTMHVVTTWQRLSVGCILTNAIWNYRQQILIYFMTKTLSNKKFIKNPSLIFLFFNYDFSFWIFCEQDWIEGFNDWKKSSIVQQLLSSFRAVQMLYVYW